MKITTNSSFNLSRHFSMFHCPYLYTFFKRYRVKKRRHDNHPILGMPKSIFEQTCICSIGTEHLIRPTWCIWKILGKKCCLALICAYFLCIFILNCLLVSIFCVCLHFPINIIKKYPFLDSVFCLFVFFYFLELIKHISRKSWIVSTAVLERFGKYCQKLYEWIIHFEIKLKYTIIDGFIQSKLMNYATFSASRNFFYRI